MGRFARRVVTGLGAIALAACTHTEAFENPDRTIDGPFAPGNPLQLTYNAGADQTPAFVPAGDGVLYAFARPGTDDGDQCLGLLPPAGGTATEWCPRSAGSRDSTDRLGEPVSLDETALLYTRASRPIGSTADAWSYLGTAPLADPDAYVPRVRFPFTASSGRLHLGAAFPVALDGDRIAYLAQRLVSASPDPEGEFAQLVVRGVEIAIASLADDAPPAPVPGTEDATSLAPGAGPGELLFTRPSDANVYVRRADGAIEVLHTFAETVREPSLAAGRLLAVVGGNVEMWFEGVPATQTAQVDFGGPLVLVDLDTGEETLITAPTARYRRPRLSPDGTFAVAQTAGSSPDLFRLELP
jgi:hypothetical protein